MNKENEIGRRKRSLTRKNEIRKVRKENDNRERVNDIEIYKNMKSGKTEVGNKDNENEKKIERQE